MFTRILETIKLYKWLLLLAVPILIFITFIIHTLSPSSQGPSLPTSLTPTLSQTPSTSDETDESGQGVLENEMDENLELRTGFQKKETGGDGNTIYTYSSENPARPDILIIDKNEELVYSRTLNSSDVPMAAVSVLIESLGQAEKIISGSKFYGKQANVYIYSSIGLAFIGDPQTDKAFEEQHFPSMSVDAYLQRFGDQN